jgi:malonate-semialdehyde dehydrogenase (acetylating)/methylmalonate-semialdehyde dehydrogenase
VLRIFDRPTTVVEGGSLHREEGDPGLHSEQACLGTGRGSSADPLVGDAQMNPRSPEQLVEPARLQGVGIKVSHSMRNPVAHDCEGLAGLEAQTFEVGHGAAFLETQGAGNTPVGTQRVQLQHACGRAMVAGSEVVIQARELDRTAELRCHDLSPHAAPPNEQALAHQLLDGLPHGGPAKGEPLGEFDLGLDAVAGAQPTIADRVLELLGKLEVHGQATSAIDGKLELHRLMLSFRSYFVKTYWSLNHTRPTLIPPSYRKQATMTARVTHWINGRHWSGTADRTGDVYDPATGQVTKKVDFASRAVLDEAVAAAKAAFPAWRDASLTKRTQVLFAFREILNANKEAVAALITEEHGKVLSDALGEVTRGQEVVEFACGIPHLMKGGFSEGVSSGVDVYSIRQPLGVVGIISPFNFPAMVPMWFFPIAIAAGNTVVVKPSEKDPSAIMLIAEMWKQAGLPDGVFNVVHGDKEAVDGLLENRDVKSISFVGSTPIAQYIYETGTKNGKRVQALGGAKNHMLVLPDADLDLAADQAINAGFGSAGERCMAISVVLAVDPIGDELVAKIAERMPALRTGDGRRGTDMGPLVTGVHRDKVRSYVDAGEAAGATLVVDGRVIDVDGDTEGFWLLPTLFDHVTTDMSIYSDEIFGPVLSVVRVPSYEAGVQLINDHPYGNGTAIFTNDGGAARRFQNEIEVGMIGINVPIPVPMAYYSFGGWKASLFGDSHAHGTEGVHFFTRGKVVTSRWLDPSHGGINLGFPTQS